MRNIFFFFGTILLVDGVFGDDVTVMEGDSVTLKPDTVIPEDDSAQWWFGDTIIAQMNKAAGRFSTSKGDDVGFNGRLELDHQTGSLTITNTRTDHTGLYKLQIKTATGVTSKIFSVTVRSGGVFGDDVTLSVMEGDSVTLNPDTVIPEDDTAQWWFGSKIIAKMNKAAGRFSTSEGDDVGFNDRLKLDHQTGSLTITNTRTDHTGLYKLLIKTATGVTFKIFSVTVRSGGVFGDDVTVMEGDSVTLNPDTVIPEDDTAQWWFGDKLIAKINKADGLFSTSKGDDVGFKGKLELDHQTGSLTITNTRTNHTGLYKLQIRGKTGVTPKIFSVTVRSGESHGYLKWLIIGLVVIIIVLILIIIFIKRKFVWDKICRKKQTLSYSSTPNPMADPRAN